MPAKTATKKQQRKGSKKSAGNGVKGKVTKKTDATTSRKKKGVAARLKNVVKKKRRRTVPPPTSKQLYVKLGHSTPALDVTIGDYTDWLSIVGDAVGHTQTKDGPLGFLLKGDKIDALQKQSAVDPSEYSYATHRSGMLDYNYNRIKKPSGLELSVQAPTKNLIKGIYEMIATRALVLAWNMSQADGPAARTRVTHVSLAESLLAGLPSSGNYPMVVSPVKRKKKTANGEDAS